jgi:hypothetical protein
MARFEVTFDPSQQAFGQVASVDGNSRVAITCSHSHVRTLLANPLASELLDGSDDLLDSSDDLGRSHRPLAQPNA